MQKRTAPLLAACSTPSAADALTLSQRPQSITLLAKTMGLPETVIASYLDHRPPTTITPSVPKPPPGSSKLPICSTRTNWCRKVDIRTRIWQPATAQGAKS